MAVLGRRELMTHCKMVGVGSQAVVQADGCQKSGLARQLHHKSCVFCKLLCQLWWFWCCFCRPQLCQNGDESLGCLVDSDV